MKLKAIRVLALGGMCLLLTGCSALPRSREMENMALLRTLGVDWSEEGYTLTASTGLRPDASGQEREKALTLTGRGDTPEQAVEDLKQNSDHVVFLGYVDQLLLGEGVVEHGVGPLLDYTAQDRELGLGARLWAIPKGTAQEGVESGGDQGVEQRLNTLRLNGVWNRSAGEV